MAHLLRLGLAVLLGLLLAPVAVLAQTAPPAVCYTYTAFGGGRTGTGTTPEAAATALATQLTSSTGECPSGNKIDDSFTFLSATTTTFTLRQFRTSLSWESTGLYTPPMACRLREQQMPNFTGVMSRVEVSCAPPPPPPPTCNRPLGQASGSSSDQYSSATYDGGLFCSGGCMVYPSTAGRSPSGQWFANGPLTSSGVACPPPSAQPSPGDDGDELEPAPAPCPPATYPGEINGTSVCVPAVDSTVNTSVTTTGTVSTPSGPVTTTTMSTTTTTCVGPTCSTRVTTTPSPGGTSGGGGGSGVGGGSTTPPVDTPRDSFCTENPRSPMCKEGRFSGSCAGGYSCEGDAIQCALAREQHVRNCAVWDGTSAERTLYDGSKALTGNRTLDLPGNDSLTIGANSFDQSNALGGGPSGMSDRSIIVSGASITIPFSQINPYLNALGTVLVAVSLLLAARIVTRG